MKNLLVTGGAGFIGSNFVHHMLAKYPRYRVVNFDKLTYAGNLASLKTAELHPNYRFINGDITDQRRVEEAIKAFNIDTIVHFAAESHVDRSIVGPKAFVMSNVVGTWVLLELARKYNIKRFHHVSTDEVFGALALDSEEKFNTETRYDPKSPYSASKAGSDHFVRAYFETFKLPITITNTSNNFGPYMDPEKFISRMITNLIDDKKIPIYGDGKYIRDWIYVLDHCKAIDLVLHKGKPGETYLAGGLTRGKEEINNLAVAKKLLKIFGKDESHIKFVKDRPGHDRRYAIDWSKIRRELGWRPTRDFDTWLARTVNWYKNNEWWWRPLKGQAEDLYTATKQK